MGLLQKIQNGNQHNLIVKPFNFKYLYLLRQSRYEKIVSVWLEAVMIREGIAEDVDASISSLENIGLLEQ